MEPIKISGQENEVSSLLCYMTRNSVYIGHLLLKRMSSSISSAQHENFPRLSRHNIKKDINQTNLMQGVTFYLQFTITQAY
jgi:hypothetical protein